MGQDIMTESLHTTYTSGMRMLPIHTILCPLDFSEPSFKALQVAIEMASHFKTEIVLLHVLPAFPGMPADPGFAFAGTEEYEKAAKEGAENELAIAAQRIPSAFAITNCNWNGRSRR
jgi:hypothetical protein